MSCRVYSIIPWVIAGALLCGCAKKKEPGPTAGAGKTEGNATVPPAAGKEKGSTAPAADTAGAAGRGEAAAPGRQTGTVMAGTAKVEVSRQVPAPPGQKGPHWKKHLIQDPQVVRALLQATGTSRPMTASPGATCLSSLHVELLDAKGGSKGTVKLFCAKNARDERKWTVVADSVLSGSFATATYAAPGSKTSMSFTVVDAVALRNLINKHAPGLRKP